MKSGSEFKRFLGAFTATIVVVAVAVRFEVVERIAHQVERGRLRARHEALSDPALAAREGRDVVAAVSPAVVSIVAEVIEPPGERDSRRVRDNRPGSDADQHSDADPSLTPDAARGDGRGLEDTLQRAPDGDLADEAGRRGELEGSTEQRLGSGVIIDAEQGLILTNAHVVSGAHLIQVVLADGRVTHAEAVGLDAHESDLALVRIGLGRLHQIELGDSDAVRVGDGVLAFGNPFGLDGTVSQGIISAVNRRQVLINENPYESLLQTDAVINPGNSGGPLVDMHGDLIGINAAIATHTGRFDGVGFAIPSNQARRLIPELLSGGPSFLGVVVSNVQADPVLAAELAWTAGYGAVVEEVMPGLAAESAGIAPRDIIVAVGSSPVRTISHIAPILAKSNPGDRVDVRVWRGGKFVAVPLTLQRRYAPPRARGS
jgi:S1-C subfamily serine protease